MRKKTIAIIAALIIVVSSIPVYAYDQDGVTVTAGRATAMPGETCSVDIVLSGNSGIWAANFKIDYDDATLTLEDAVKGNDVLTFVRGGLEQSPYVYYCEYNDLMSNADVNGTLVTLKFRVSEDAKPGEYPITFTPMEGGSFIAIDENDIYGEHVVDSKFVPGSVAVAGNDEERPPAHDPLESFTYVIKNGEITITGHTGASSTVVIGEYYTIDGRDMYVTAIGESAFENASIISVTIPSSVRKIGDWAFYNCKLLEDVIILGADVEIGECAIGYEYVSRTESKPQEKTVIYSEADSKARNYAVSTGIGFSPRGQMEDSTTSLSIVWGPMTFTRGDAEGDWIAPDGGGYVTVKNIDTEAIFVGLECVTADGVDAVFDVDQDSYRSGDVLRIARGIESTVELALFGSPADDATSAPEKIILTIGVE